MVLAEIDFSGSRLCLEYSRYVCMRCLLLLLVPTSCCKICSIGDFLQTGYKGGAPSAGRVPRVLVLHVHRLDDSVAVV